VERDGGKRGGRVRSRRADGAPSAGGKNEAKQQGFGGGRLSPNDERENPRRRAAAAAPPPPNQPETHGGAISTLARRLCLAVPWAIAIMPAPRRGGENCVGGGWGGEGLAGVAIDHEG
jgi:hypothetical protein